MFKQKIFILSFIVLVLVASFNYLGVTFSLYWVYKWYDIPMHMLGGLWVSLFTLSFYPYLNKHYLVKDFNINPLYAVFISLLFMIIAWEIFELIGGMALLSDRGYWPDTLGDVLNGYIGGIVGYLFYLKENNVELLRSKIKILK